MKHVINRLINGDVLEKETARQVLLEIAEGKHPHAQVASFLTVYMMRSITLKELQGFQEALMDLCIAIDLDAFNPIDLCGTGGDGKNTFNISTLASFVVAGAGIPVAKHGNYGVSSGCGSSNVLEYLGIRFTNNDDFLKKCMEKAGICILHAPLFHPAMKQVAPVRKELGLKTFFNMLGPLVNPCNPKQQLTGVFSLELARLYGYYFQNASKKYAVVYDLNGYDEISLTGAAKILSHKEETLLHPTDFKIPKVSNTDIEGGNDVASAARIFTNVLEGKGTPQQEYVVCANAAWAISIVSSNDTIENSFKKAQESIHSGKALHTFKTLHALSQ